MEKMIENIVSILNCEKDELSGFEKINAGMMNKSFIFSLRGEKYVYRCPGEGTEKLVNRRNEKQANETAHMLGFDPTYIYMDGDDGFKISRYAENCREPDYENEDDTCIAAKTLRRLHAAKERTDFGLDPWNDVKELEKMAEAEKPGCLSEHRALREKIGKLYEATVGDGIEKCFCHGDAYKNNWMIKPDGEVILIDWEYAGTSDPGIDVGYFIIDAGYDFAQAKRFICEYLDSENDEAVFHFMAYSAIISYYWFVWAVYRENCGEDTHGALEHWKNMAYRYAETERKSIWKK